MAAESERTPAPFAVERAAELLATVAWFDLASAFSLWCHLVTMSYLTWALPDSWLRHGLLPQLQQGAVYGSTAIATALGHAQTGRSLPVRATLTASGGIVLQGFVPWASNLTGRFVMVVPVGSQDGSLVVVVPGERRGVVVEPYPALLALQATASSSVRFADVVLEPEWVLHRDALDFLRVVQPTFLSLQSAFCWGLAARAVEEASRSLSGVNTVFESALHQARDELCQLAVRLRLLTDRALEASGAVRRQAVELRLEVMRLAVEAVALEAKVKGGQAYRADSPTARRLREAAFLPLQSPTEGQLRWELQRSG